MAGRHGGLLGPRRVRVGVRIAGRRSGIGIASVNGSGGLDGIDDLLVACAATQVTLNGLCDLIPGGSVVFVEQRLRGNEETRRTKAALRTPVRGKASLDGCEMSPVGEALDRDDLGALNLPGQGEAGEFWHTVDHDRATTTRAEVASSLHAERADLVSENVQQHGVARREAGM